MTDYIRLADGTEFKIKGGASLDNIVYDAVDEADGLEIAKKVTKDNVSHVEFFSKSEEGESYDPSGVYDNLKLVTVYFDVPNLKVLITLSEKNEYDLFMDEMRESQEDQNEMIDYLAMQ